MGLEEHDALSCMMCKQKDGGYKLYDSPAHQNSTLLQLFTLVKMASLGEDHPDSDTRTSLNRCLSCHVCPKLGLGDKQVNGDDDDDGNSRTMDHISRLTKRETEECSEKRANSPVFYSEHAGSVKCSECHQDVLQDSHDHRFFSPTCDRILPPSSSSTNSKGRDVDIKNLNKTQSKLTETFRQSPAAKQSNMSNNTDLNDSTFGTIKFAGQASTKKCLKVQKTGADVFAAPTPKMFTRIVARDEVDGTPANDAKTLNQIYMDAMADEDSGYGSPAPFPGRPCRVGREKMDIVAELRQHDPVLLEKILSEFSAEDIVRFSGVCKEWSNIIGSNRLAASKKRHFLQHRAKPKRTVKENYPRQSFQRATVSASAPLGEVQRVGEPQASSTPAPRIGNHDKFCKASESLLVDESLIKCVKGACQSPARLLMNGQRAQCTRCAYDFCTNCHCEFHVSSVCPVLKGKNTAKRPNGIGSGKSKRSLRRIARLESFP